MAKRKSHQRKPTASAAAKGTEAVGEAATQTVAELNMALLLIIAAVVVPVAVLMKMQFDAMAEESSLSVAKQHGDLVANNILEESSDTAPEANMPQQEQLSFEDMSTWQFNMHFAKTYDSKGLHARLKKTFDATERAFSPSDRKLRLNPGLATRGGGFDRTTRHKLLHDLEQFDYFMRSDAVNVGSPEVFQTVIPQRYRSTLERLDRAAKDGTFDEEKEYYRFQREDIDGGIMTFYNRMILTPNIPHMDAGSLLTPRDWGKVEREWLGEDVSHPHPGIVVIDNLLSPETLHLVRQYLLISTFWYQTKTPEYGKYVGAYLGDGMNNQMLIDTAFQLHKAMPRVMEGHPLKEIWAYKYESSSEEDEERTGIHTHADDAMVNVNIWLTPDDANLDPSSGGLVVYTVKPPREWDFSSFNSNWKYVEENLLRPSGFANVTIPYKQNRAVIFDSFLFHKTDKHRFKKGYENRRINLTFLYGERQSIDTSKAS